jgi:hypothetical protein
LGQPRSTDDRTLEEFHDVPQRLRSADPFVIQIVRAQAFLGACRACCNLEPEPVQRKKPQPQRTLLRRETMDSAIDVDFPGGNEPVVAAQRPAGRCFIAEERLGAAIPLPPVVGESLTDFESNWVLTAATRCSICAYVCGTGVTTIPPSEAGTRCSGNSSVFLTIGVVSSESKACTRASTFGN